MKPNNTPEQSTNNQSGQWAKWLGAGVAGLLVALLFRGCGTYDQTVTAPKTPAVTAAVATTAAAALNPMQLTGVNSNGKFTLSGVVPTEQDKAAMDAELKKTFGDNGYLNNLTVAANIKPSTWFGKISGMFDLLKLPGAEMSINDNIMTLSGTAGSLKDKLQAHFGDTMTVNALNTDAIAKTATSDALAALNALSPDASGQDILKALGLQIINFSSGSTAIPADNQTVLKKAAELLKSKKDFKFTIEGHADNQGKAAENMTLSDKRAQAVRSFLIANGVSDSTVSAKGFGETQPIADNAAETGRLKNRRIAYKAM